MPNRVPSSSSGNFVPGGSACSIIARRSARQAKSTRLDFLLIGNLDAVSAPTFGDMSHTIIYDLVHRMGEFWSMRSNKRRHAAQSLCFDCRQNGDNGKRM